MTDIGGDRHVVRAREIGAGQQRLAEGDCGVDIEIGRLERGIEARRAAGGGKDISEAAGDGLAVEFGLQAFDRDLVAAERDVAAQAQGPQFSLPRGRTALSHAVNAFASLVLISAGPANAMRLSSTAKWPLTRTLREAGRAEFETVQVPPAGVGADIAAQILHGIAAERGLVDADADLDRDLGRKAPPANSASLRMAAAGGRRAPSPSASARSRSIWRPDSTPSKRGELAGLEIGNAGQVDALILRAVLEFEIRHQRRRRRHFDLSVHAPGLAQRGATAQAMPTGRVMLRVPSKLAGLR